jgi:heme-degrading monooxygenase HmoA
MELFADTPPPPYYVVIFSSTLRTHSDAYEKIAKRMVQLAKAQPGFLGIESVRNGFGITLSYWKDESSIKNWKQETEHLAVQKMGKENWYKSFKVRVARIERDYSFEH